MSVPYPARNNIAEINARCFVWFRILFNCRFYYPIFTVLFLDFGLTIAQFATLNALWAISIVLLEVPSGALADQLGRLRLVRFSAWLMVVEMLCLCLVPIGGGWWTIGLLALNRVLSGAAEAAASGADEALMFDSLPEEGREEKWRGIQTQLIRWQSLASIAATLIGATLYDAKMLNRWLGYLGVKNFTLEQTMTMRWPLWLCLLMAVATLIVTYHFKKTPNEPERAQLNVTAIKAALVRVWQTGRWALATPVVVMLLSWGLLFDGAMRLFYTVLSQYYRLIELPVYWNGWAGVGISLLGFFLASALAWIVTKLTASQLYGGLGVMVAIGLLLMVPAWPYWGLVAVLPFAVGMRALHYFLSVHLNQVIEPDRRATALSFRGLTMNLCYALIMQTVAWQTGLIKEGLSAVEATDNQVMRLALPWWPAVFMAVAISLVLFFRWRYRRSLTQWLAVTA
jgi:MFS family permease